MKNRQLRWLPTLGFSLCLPLMALASTNAATNSKEDQDYPPDLLLMKMELNTFVYMAQAIDEGDLADDSDELEQQHKELMKTGERIADIYFRNATNEIRGEMDEQLARTLDEEQALKNYFVYMGNGFVTRAQAFIQDREDQESRIRFFSTIGGAILGAAGGGGYLFFKSRSAALTLKDYLIATTAVIGGGAAGNLGVAKAINTYLLPVDLSVRSAKDFMLRYPNGEDFIESLDPQNEDLNAIGELAEELLDEAEGFDEAIEG